SKIRRCGRGHGRSSKSSPSRATTTTEFITSRAASRETMASRGCCVDGAWKSAPLRKDEVLIGQPATTGGVLWPLHRIGSINQVGRVTTARSSALSRWQRNRFLLYYGIKIHEHAGVY